MKKILIVVPCVVALTLASPANAENSTIIVETNSHNVFTGLFRTVWAHFRSLNPSQKESARSEILYNAGIRGAESTDTLLQPYWKGDLSQDRQFQAQLQNFDLAQAKLDQGELAAAALLFDDFLQKFEHSALRPNALFGKGISLAGSGKNEQSLSAIRQFVEENPRHPLVKDARLVIDELR